MASPAPTTVRPAPQPAAPAAPTLTVAHTPAEATAAPGEFRAGGTDVQERRRSGVSSGPLVDLTALRGLSDIELQRDGSVQLGTLVTVHTIATNPLIGQSYRGLALAAGGLATPQIRRMGTLGGNLLQRSRCWYYRHPAFDCYQKGGEGCPAREGHHQHGVCFDLGGCVHPHPSTVGVALLAYDAEVTIEGHASRPMAALFGDGRDPRRLHTLEAGQLLTHITLPPATPQERTAYFRAISRAAAEWPLVEAVVRLGVEGGTIAWAKVAVGGVAPIPMRLPAVEAALQGAPATQATLETAATKATLGANPLPLTRYKVELLARTVLETLERALNG